MITVLLRLKWPCRQPWAREWEKINQNVQKPSFIKNRCFLITVNSVRSSALSTDKTRILREKLIFSRRTHNWCLSLLKSFVRSVEFYGSKIYGQYFQNEYEENCIS